jgi:hypothetical protein
VVAPPLPEPPVLDAVVAPPLPEPPVLDAVVAPPLPEPPLRPVLPLHAAAPAARQSQSRARHPRMNFRLLFIAVNPR